MILIVSSSSANEPSLNEVKKRGSSFVDSLVSKNFELIQKSRWSFVLPTLKLDADKNRQDTLSIGSTGSGITTDTDNNNRIGFGGSISWDFKGILYNDAEPKLLKDIFNLYEFKLGKLNQMTTLYFQIESLRRAQEKSEAEKLKLFELEEKLRILYEN